MILTMMLAGCSALSHQSVPPLPEANIQNAREALDRGEYYKARSLTREILSLRPEDPEAEALMAEILSQEISQQKEIFSKVPEEYTPDEKEAQARTWLERARELFRQKNYEEAMLAAEKVFTYQPDSVEASYLIDQIRSEIRREGKSEAVFLKRMYQDEIQGRVDLYKSQASEWMEKGQWSKAALAVEKALLLNPEDKEAIRIHNQIKNQGKGQP